ncbi:GNAT family N-acetyltransferase [Massilia sp. Leaf139]|uniref:GNAT family N-acetyltransferase n=1 Tax=Massilia sp. Leaf139 TaxID=1736272 RepID=UPI0006F59D1F|nr:GNAT family N-acetyltransferase [Massilia sp. Leaf139]KQQ94937.1 hypothetical protein ASF77_22035 [Massilia sp. Leaf139]
MFQNTLSYRRATVEDLPSICELGQVVNRLHHAAWPQLFEPNPDRDAEQAHWLKSLEGDAAATFLSCDGEIDVGFVTVHVAEERHCLLRPLRFARIGTLCVAEPMRGRGIGRTLMEYAERWAASQGASEIQLEVWTFNQPAERLYEELGYAVRSSTMSKPIRPDAV